MTIRHRGLARLATVAAAIVLFARQPSPFAAAHTGALPCDLSTTGRIVAIGDIHGAYDRFIRILQAATLIDARQRWTGGDTVLVQTGDVVDRGADSRRALDLLRKLEGDAARAGGLVVPLLGNHEVMAMTGDLRYVSAGEYAAFRTMESDALRERVYQSALARASDRAKASGQRLDEGAFRKQFLDATPLGSIELQLAFGPDGTYGRWLRDHQTMVRINGVAFVHGGINPSTAVLGCTGINETVRAELKAVPIADPSKLASLLATRDDGPLWYRGLALESEPGFGAEVTGILKALDARAIVIGHSVPQSMRITTRFDGRVVQIDTGMLGESFFPGGRASALDIRDGRFTAIYEDSREELPVRLTLDRPAAAEMGLTPLPAAAR